jgi:hypothetical protein
MGSLQKCWWAASLCTLCKKLVEDYGVSGVEGGAEGVTVTIVTLIAI